ncbi:hypothetical protein DPMN_034318 [Dreissena polymorpha]|uniref:Uncharacterized protein n=1 Tax=Dreissena polymorpha TaxID=45954 RepID=A0A9D4RJZ4_DREPO|nr:hypothetical protein DPMN_034318 [Dreissena polymorpha]
MSFSFFHLEAEDEFALGWGSQTARGLIRGLPENRTLMQNSGIHRGWFGKASTIYVGETRYVIMTEIRFSVGAITTADTLERHGKIAGGFSREVQETYTNLFSGKKEFRREEDLKAISRRDESVTLPIVACTTLTDCLPCITQRGDIDCLPCVTQRGDTADSLVLVKVDPINPSRLKSTQDTPSQTKSTQVNPSQPKSTQVNPSQPKTP